MADKKTFLVDREPLKRFAKEVFLQRGMPDDYADIVAELLVWANLRGVDSHGVIRIPRYLELLDSTEVNDKPEVKLLRETPATLLMEGDRAFGALPMVEATERAIEKARNTGIGYAVVRDMAHAGAAGYYTLMAVEQGMAGIAMLGGIPNMAYHGSKVAGLGTNPIAMAVPGGKYKSVVLDMATAIVAHGKFRQARDEGRLLPEGWALDKEGNPTVDPSKAQVPFSVGGPKGSGLSLMFEFFSSVLGHNAVLAEHIPNKTEGARRHRQNGVICAIDIAAFCDPDEYRSDVDATVEAIKTLPKLDGVEEILMPGEIEDRNFAKRSKDGIPLPQGTWNNLQKFAADRFDIAMPETKA